MVWILVPSLISINLENKLAENDRSIYGIIHTKLFEKFYQDGKMLAFRNFLRSTKWIITLSFYFLFFLINLLAIYIDCCSTEANHSIMQWDRILRNTLTNLVPIKRTDAGNISMMKKYFMKARSFKHFQIFFLQFTQQI